jgi:hypothetical protein
VLRSTATIRERCGNILRAVVEGRSPHFTLDRSKLDGAVALVEQVTRSNYPDLRIPYHSRWRHFEAGGVDRKRLLDARLKDSSAAVQARARIDLTVVSVLLDAGAGPQWRFDEDGRFYSRSEGLGIASFHGFMRGAFSSNKDEPCRVDAAALKRIDASVLADMLQVTDTNPLVGLDGRAALLRRLGETMLAQPEAFGSSGRPGHLFDRLTDSGEVTKLAAPQVLQALLDHLGPIWMTGSELGGVPLGDCWPHPHAGGEGATAGWVPFHKLSQWMTYSLLEPFEWAGVALSDVDGMTGLPEYRNGGLLLDAGVLLPRDAAFASTRYRPSDEFIVEWRALTVALLDELAPLVRARLGASAAQMPLARILEGGTWAAGRAIAKTMRDGRPPLDIESDGTVF